MKLNVKSVVTIAKEQVEELVQAALVEQLGQAMAENVEVVYDFDMPVEKPVKRRKRAKQEEPVEDTKEVETAPEEPVKEPEVPTEEPKTIEPVDEVPFEVKPSTPAFDSWVDPKAPAFDFS